MLSTKKVSAVHENIPLTPSVRPTPSSAVLFENTVLQYIKHWSRKTRRMRPPEQCCSNTSFSRPRQGNGGGESYVQLAPVTSIVVHELRLGSPGNCGVKRDLQRATVSVILALRCSSVVRDVRFRSPGNNRIAVDKHCPPPPDKNLLLPKYVPAAQKTVE